MGFYGLLVGICIIASLSAVASMGAQAQTMNRLAYQYQEYRGALALSALAQAAAAQHNVSAAGQQNWAEAVRIAAMQDGIGVAQANGSTVLETDYRPRQAAIAR